jgi:hypothetical protein
MRPITYCGVVLTLCSAFLWAQNGQSNNPADQPSPTPAATNSVSTPASPAEVLKLQEMLKKPITPHTSSDPVPPPRVVYQFFFQNLAHFDAMAAELEAEGKDGSRWRTHVQRLAGLTVTEGQILKEVAFDCNKQTEANDKRIGGMIKVLRQQYPLSQYLKIPSPELDQLWEKRTQIINDHIVELQVLLGQTSFQKLDDYVQGPFRSARKDPSVPSQANTPAAKQGPRQ